MVACGREVGNCTFDNIGSAREVCVIAPVKGNEVDRAILFRL
jgi:hypothetical protein